MCTTRKLPFLYFVPRNLKQFFVARIKLQLVLALLVFLPEIRYSFWCVYWQPKIEFYVSVVENICIYIWKILLLLFNSLIRTIHHSQVYKWSVYLDFVACVNLFCSFVLCVSISCKATCQPFNCFVRMEFCFFLLYGSVSMQYILTIFYTYRAFYWQINRIH